MCIVKSAPQDMMFRNHEIKGAKSLKQIPNEIHFNHLFDTYNQLVSESVVTGLGWVQKNLWLVNIREFLVTTKRRSTREKKKHRPTKNKKHPNPNIAIETTTP